MNLKLAQLILILALGLILVPIHSAWALNVKVVGGNLVILTHSQQQDVFNFCLTMHPNQVVFCNQVVTTTIAVQLTKDSIIITATEDHPGEILPCVAIVVVGGIGGGQVQSFAEQIKGDGSFNTPPQSAFPSWGTILDFHGTPSTQVPLTLKIELSIQ